MPQEFNLREWQNARGLTSKQLTDYLNGLGMELSLRTVEGYTTKGCPTWLPPLLRQRDALNALYEKFGPLHDAVIAAAHAPLTRGKVSLIEQLNIAGDACDKLEGIFGQYLTDAERGDDGT